MPTLSFRTIYVSHVLAYAQARTFRGSGDSRNLVIGGAEAEIGRHPYMVSLQDEHTHFCGASLIAPDIVLTAAHCESPDLSAAVGRHHWMEEKEGGRLEISEHIPHPGFDYYGDNYDNDIMLLVLEKSLLDIPVVKLNSDTKVPIPDEPVTVMGWGDTDIDWLKFEMSDALKSAEVFVESNAECEASQAEIRGDPHWYENHVTGNMICAEAKGADACQNDSGGPLVVLGENHDSDVQVGIVSWGYECANKHFPGVYTRVSNYYEWIREHVCEKSSNPPDSFDCFSQHVSSDDELSIVLSFEGKGSETANKIEIEFDVRNAGV